MAIQKKAQRPRRKGLEASFSGQIPPPSLTAIREARKHSILWPYKDIRGIAPLALHPTLLYSPCLRDLSCFWFPLIDNSLMPALESSLPKKNKKPFCFLLNPYLNLVSPVPTPLLRVPKPVHLLTPFQIFNPLPVDAGVCKLSFKRGIVSFRYLCRHQSHCFRHLSVSF